MNKKKDLKTVDIEELQSSEPLHKVDPEEEIIYECGVDVEDLDSRGSKKISRPASPNARSGKVVEAGSELKKRELNLKTLKRLEERKVFDRKAINYKGLYLIFSIILVGYFCEKAGGSLGFEDGDQARSLATTPLRWFFHWVGFLGKYYPAFALGSLAFIPLKKNTTSMYEIGFEGLVVPSEADPSVRSIRKKVAWRDVKRVEFSRVASVPLMRLYNQHDRVLGEMRLDVDNPKNLGEAIAKFSPSDHPVRKLINN